MVMCEKFQMILTKYVELANEHKCSTEKATLMILEVLQKHKNVCLGFKTMFVHHQRLICHSGKFVLRNRDIGRAI